LPSIHDFSYVRGFEADQDPAKNAILVGMGSQSPPVEEAAGREHEDTALGRAVLRKDRKATAEFVDRFSGAVYRYVRWRLAPDTALIEDVVQEVFVAAWQRLADYRGASSLQSWLLGIARHKVEDHYRARLREAEMPEGDIASETHLEFEEHLDRERAAGRTARILAGLPEHYRSILLWRYWDRRSAREIAAETGRTEKAIERLLARAREQFRQRWLHE
jgi:RNA polymerase sigma-70 factor (ECF subfamily)